MNILTHTAIAEELCGEPTMLSAGESRVRLAATPAMAADEAGLVHGGFIFGLADYAAMLAVNHPNVVLGGARCSFVKPVRVGEILEADASVREESGRRRRVEVTVRRSGETVFTGEFQCHVPDRHVLSPSESA